MKLSIVIPVYNEKDTIEKVLDKVNSVKLGKIKKEVIIVDDHSTDGTTDVLKKLSGYKIFFHQKNIGKGSAIRTALKYVTGDIIVVQDADLEYNPEDYKKLLKPILAKKAKVVYGSRFLENHKARYRIYYMGNILLSFITRLIYNRKITDMETCYKMFTRNVIKKIKLRAKGFDFEPEITAKLLKNGYKIVEVPVSYSCRSFSEGKKISWKDGIKAIWYLVKYRFVD